MNIKKIQDTLQNIFFEKDERIIFWYDGEKEFEEALSEIQLDNVKVIHLWETSSLKLKIDIELEESTSKYLLYASFHEPSPEDNWLLDIQLYSYIFHADKASIIFKELNLKNQSLQSHIKKRYAFFNSKDRFNRLIKWLMPDDTENDIDLKMLTVITRSDSPDLFSILMKLYGACCDKDTFDASLSSKYWSDIEKLNLTSAFWDFVTLTFGYINKEKPSLHNLLLRIFATDFSNQLKNNNELCKSIEHFVIKDPSYSMNSTVFLSQWRSNINQFKNYNLISKYIAEKHNIERLIDSAQLEELMDIITFEVVEKRIISDLRDQIIHYDSNNILHIQELIKQRLDGYWANITLNDESNINLYKTAYNALESAIQFFNLRSKYNEGFSYSNAEKMFDVYTKELFLFDQLYRKFSELSDLTEKAGWDILKELRQSVEDCYSNWFMDEISLKWGDFLDGLISKWSIPDFYNQYDFFKRYIQPTLKGSNRNRIFVVISDAFRYEAAEELEKIINGKYRMQAKLKPILGVLPSYTGLGMAALLPYEKLSFKAESDNILVDEKLSNSIEYRNNILSNHNGVSIKAEDLTSMNKEQGRDLIKPYRVIYIYHDQIDATGDKANSESRTFEGVRKAIDDLSSLIKYIINNLNGNKVFITADHGFVYQDKPPSPIDKSAVDKTDKEIIINKKRFIMGHHLNNSDNAFKGNTKITANTDTDMDFLIPKGTNRFNFQGGAKYYHGGALLQEIVLPVLTVKQMKGKHLEKSEINHVSVSLIGNYKKIVTNIFPVNFIQTDAVSERYKARTLKISLRDKNDLVSDEKMLTFDSSSSILDERKKSVSLTLKTGQNFDRKKEYHLVLRNANDDTEYDRFPLLIDIAFASDF